MITKFNIMKHLFFTIYLSFILLILGCSKAKKESPLTPSSSIQKSTNPAEDLLGKYSTQKSKSNEVNFKIVKENGKCILYEYNKNHKIWKFFFDLQIISGEDTKAFVGYSIFTNLMSDTGFYTNKSGEICFFKIKQGSEIRTTWSSGKPASNYLILYSNGIVKNGFKVSE